MNSQSNILVSIVIPCYNEKEFIAQTINSLLSQKNVNGEQEIIVVDGMSDDGTREILESFSLKDEKLKILDNHKKITPTALNIGIKNANGEYICIMGAHSEYDENYIANCLKIFEQNPIALCVGGPIISKGKNNFSKAAALAMSSYIGVGNAKHRFPDYEGFAEMACFPMMKKSVFKMIGYYDEKLIKNQDDEFCFRLRRNGGKIYISPIIKSEYYVRDKPLRLFEQYFNYGVWRIAVLRKHKIPIALRQFAPTLFLFLVFLLALGSFISDNVIIGFFLPVSYTTILFLFTLNILFKHGIKISLNFFLAVLILHFSYAFGFIVGLFRNSN
jgi:glycosyltransferase involved in cell wall biosynthesis